MTLKDRSPAGSGPLRLTLSSVLRVLVCLGLFTILDNQIESKILDPLLQTFLIGSKVKFHQPIKFTVFDILIKNEMLNPLSYSLHQTFLIESKVKFHQPIISPLPES